MGLKIKLFAKTFVSSLWKAAIVFLVACGISALWTFVRRGEVSIESMLTFSIFVGIIIVFFTSGKLFNIISRGAVTPSGQAMSSALVNAERKAREKSNLAPLFVGIGVIIIGGILQYLHFILG